MAMHPTYLCDQLQVNQYGDSQNRSAAAAIVPATLGGIALIRCGCSHLAWTIEALTAVVFGLWVLASTRQPTQAGFRLRFRYCCMNILMARLISTKANA